MTLPTETRAERDLRRLRTLYRALGDETRLRVISLLAEFGPMPVNELSARVDLVETQRQGREVICRLRTAAFEELHELEARLIGGTSGIGMARPSSASEVTDVG
jgi:DNA-binding transcriptional ArsR family regulator